MKRLIRKNTFETNSSSAHSIVIDTKTKVYETLPVNDMGEVRIVAEEFGWAFEKLVTPATKAAYLIQQEGYTYRGLSNSESLVKEVIREHTGALKVELEYADDGYIDHDSVGEFHKVLESKDLIKDFIFNPNSELYTGNDNSTPPEGYPVDYLVIH